MSSIKLSNTLLWLLPYIIISLFLFIGSLYIGYAYVLYSSASQSGILLPIFEPFKALAEMFKRLTPVERFLLIFLNNSTKGLLNILLGPLFGIYPLVFIVFNGFVAGFTFAFVALKKGLTVALLSILPHGVLEVPATIICNALGFKLAISAIRSILKKGSFRRDLKRGLRIYVYVVLPMLFGAALIEVYITPRLVGIEI